MFISVWDCSINMIYIPDLFCHCSTYIGTILSVLSWENSSSYNLHFLKKNVLRCFIKVKLPTETKKGWNQSFPIRKDFKSFVPIASVIWEAIKMLPPVLYVSKKCLPVQESLFLAGAVWLLLISCHFLVSSTSIAWHSRLQSLNQTWVT